MIVAIGQTIKTQFWYRGMYALIDTVFHDLRMTILDTGTGAPIQHSSDGK